MTIVAQCGPLYLLADDPERATRDFHAHGDYFNAQTGQRVPVNLHGMLKQHGYWEPWDGKPVAGLPESQPAPASA